MPLYQVEHICSLTSSQQEQLAEVITTIHSRKFTTPSLFVNVTFTDISSQVAFVAGKKVSTIILQRGPALQRGTDIIPQRNTNRLLAHIRTGPSRTTEDYNSLTSSLNKAWCEIVGSTGEQELGAVFILGDIVAGSEAGFVFPPAGGDKKWLREHFEEFESRAKEGDEGFAGLVKEVREREDLKEVLGKD